MSALVELRVLDGPNLYLTRAAITLTLDVTVVLRADSGQAERLAAALGLGPSRPGAPGSGFRQRFAVRVVAALVRRVAAAAGVTRLAVRVRTTARVERLVVAYAWRRRETARALGQEVAGLLEGLAERSDCDVAAAVDAAGERIRDVDPGPRPPTIVPAVPVVAVTGTNGKTTTARLVAHAGRFAGLHVGWSSTDGIYLDGALVEAGDYSGPSGAGRVLAQPQVQLAVTETARGGILLRGIGVTRNDVSVVTNVSADHLGLHGIDTVDQLAEVKQVVARITRPDGWAVLNGDDPRTLAMAAVTRARVWVFSRDPAAPALRQVLATGGRATTVVDGWVSVLEPDRDPRPLVAVEEVPVTLAGLSHVNVENVLAAASAALAVGVPDDAVCGALRDFAPGPERNPGRMNVYSLGDVTVVVDLAHNEAGLDALLEVMRGLRPVGGRLRLGLGTAGDRTDEIVARLGETAARGADDVVVVHKSDYLRGRDPAELTALYRSGARLVGVSDLPAYDSELAGLQALVRRARPGDVVAVMTHQDRAQLDGWLRTQGADVDDPDTLRRKVRAAGH